MTKLEILNKHIDFSKDGVIERENALQAMQEYADQQFSLYGVSKRFPDRLDLAHKKDTMLYDKLKNPKIKDGFSWKVGFTDCYEWLEKELT